MKCDRCENESTVHELRIEAGQRREKHLCEQCARAEGVAAPQLPAPITQLLSTFMLQQGEAAAHAPALAPGTGNVAPCPSCATTYAQFRQSGLLGCATCYSQFENQLAPLLARAHEGGTHHTGKTARRFAGTVAAPPAPASALPPGTSGAPIALIAPLAPPKIDPMVVAKALSQRIALLKKKLAEAIASEHYENAAKFRDELARLEGSSKPGESNPPPTATPAPKRKPRPTGDRPPPTSASDENATGGGP